MSIETKTLTDKLKGAPSTTDVTGKSVLLTDAGGKLSKASAGSTIKGLDADTVDGMHNGELTALKFKTIKKADANTTLDANADLNNGGYLYNNYSYSKWANAPTGMNVGAILAFANDRNSTSFISQFAWDNNKRLWFRSANAEGNDYYAWKEIAFTTSNVASADKLTAKQLTNENLDDVKSKNLAVYYANGGHSIANVPSGVGSEGFYLQVYGIGTNYCTQLLTRANSNIIYQRINSNNTWTKWRRLLHEDDLAPLIARISALEART